MRHTPASPMFTTRTALRGLYADQLDAWLKVFPREQILVLAAEALFADTRAAVRQALAFLDLPDTRLDLSENGTRVAMRRWTRRREKNWSNSIDLTINGYTTS